MFTGLVIGTGRVAAVEERPGRDMALAIATNLDLADALPGASIACSGVCLTLTGREGGLFHVDVSAETRARTAAGLWAAGARLNLERALRVGDELGGHIVTGHVDGVGRIAETASVEGSTRLLIAAPAALAPMIASKGSIAVDGVSLTVNDVEDGPDGCRFSVNIIPHTAAHTTLGDAPPGRELNLEVDILARYLDRMMAARQAVHTPM